MSPREIHKGLGTPGCRGGIDTGHADQSSVLPQLDDAPQGGAGLTGIRPSDDVAAQQLSAASPGGQDLRPICGNCVSGGRSQQRPGRGSPLQASGDWHGLRIHQNRVGCVSAAVRKMCQIESTRCGLCKVRDRNRRHEKLTGLIDRSPKCHGYDWGRREHGNGAAEGRRE